MHRIIAGLAVAALVLAAPIQSHAADPANLSGSVPNGVLRATLPNGLRVVVVPDRLAPVVTTELVYLAGSNDAPVGFPGMAHALEHMMFRGSEGLDRDQLAELGAQLGGVYNASTTETVTQYTYTVPAADLGVALKVESLRMRGLTLSQPDWEQERGAIEQEVSRDLSSPFYLYMAQLQAILFAGTPYEHDALGTRESFDRTDAVALRQFYDRWYAPNNAILVIAGDVQPAAAMAQAAAAFGAIPSHPVPAHEPFALTPVVARTIALPTNFATGIVGIAFRMPGLTSTQFAAADVLGDVLGSERGALYGLVPAGRALSAQFSYQALPGAGFGLALAAFPAGGDPAPLLASLRGVLQAAANGDISDDLVEASKRQELAQLAFANDSISGLARSWARALAQQGLQSPDDVAQAYAAVTTADVRLAARTLLDLDHAVTAVLTPRGEGAPAMSGGFGGGESFASVPEHEVALPAWAAETLASLNLPPLVGQPDVSVLPNGLRLIVQPERVSRTVSVYGRIRQVADMQEPAGQEGVAALTSAMFGYGTASRDRLAFRKAIDDIAAVESAGPSFGLKVLSPEFEHGMQLLAENELHPRLDEATFSVLRGQQEQSRAGLLRSPGYRAGYAANQAIVPAGDPTLRQATPASVAALSLDDVRAFHAAAYRPDLATVVVLGDVTPEEARRVVTATFGGWSDSGPTPAIDLPKIGASAASEVRIPDPGALQDQVILHAAVDVPVDSPDRYTLMLGNSILGSGFSSRLYRDLRVKTGYVYSVSSGLDWTRTRADYTVSFGADPDKVERARALVLRDIHDMQTTPVSETELRRAKAQVLRRLPMQRASVGAVAALYLRLAELGLPWDAEDIAARSYNGVTAAQIQAAFAGALHPEALAQVTRGPAAP